MKIYREECMYINMFKFFQFNILYKSIAQKDNFFIMMFFFN